MKTNILKLITIIIFTSFAVIAEDHIIYATVYTCQNGKISADKEHYSQNYNNEEFGMCMISCKKWR